MLLEGLKVLILILEFFGLFLCLGKVEGKLGMEFLEVRLIELIYSPF